MSVSSVCAKGITLQGRRKQLSVGVAMVCARSPSLASQPLFLRGGARGGGREKESGDLSQRFVFSAGM